MANKGIIFNVINDKPPTSIPLGEIDKVSASAVTNAADNSVSLVFTIKFKKDSASIDDMPPNMEKKGFIPFINANNEFRLSGFKQGQRQLAVLDDPATYELSVDLPDGKIGGANLFRLQDPKTDTQGLEVEL